MDALVQMQGLVKRIFVILGTILIIFLIAFLFHVIQTNTFNNMDRTVTADSVTMEVTTDIHPRGLVTDAWEKNDAFSALKELSQQMDYDGAKSVLDMLSEYKLPDESVSKVDELNKALKNYDWDAMEAVLG